jgi:hypothetical protein
MASDVGNPYFAAENTYYGIHVSVLYANTGVFRSDSGENTPRMAVSLHNCFTQASLAYQTATNAVQNFADCTTNSYGHGGFSKTDVCLHPHHSLRNIIWALKFNPSASHSMRKA